MICNDCNNETIDKHRTCVICGAPLCWEHVTRVAITVHGPNGATWEEPVYLCRFHLKERLGLAIQNKHYNTPIASPERRVALENMMSLTGIMPLKSENSKC